MKPDRSSEKVSWGEVCQKVGFSDGLYASCRDRIAGFDGTFEDDSGGMEGDESFDDVDFGAALARSAMPVPPPPPEGWQQPAEGFFADLMQGNTGKYLAYSGVAALLFWWFWIRPRQQVVVTETARTLPAMSSATSRAA